MEVNSLLERIQFSLKVVFCAIVLSVFSMPAGAQDIRSPGYATPAGNPFAERQNTGSNPFAQQEEGEEQEGADSTRVRERAERNPLESYFFADSMSFRQNFSWRIDPYRNRVVMSAIDTAINSRQIEYPFFGEGVGDAYLGTLGSAAIPVDYSQRPAYRDFRFAEVFDLYLFTPEKSDFYNLKQPYTNLSYFSGGQKKYQEESVWVTHAQNISPSTGFNFNFKSQGTNGFYAWQKSRDKNLSIVFNHTGRKYSVHGGYIYNSIDLHENGGIQNVAHVRDSIFELPENIPVNLHDATNNVRSNTFFLVQSLGTSLRRARADELSISGSPSLFIGHSLEWSRYKRKYYDTWNGSSTGFGEDAASYYKNWLYDSLVTTDSLYESLLSNRLFVQIQPYDRNAIIGTLDGGVGIDNHGYYFKTLYEVDGQSVDTSAVVNRTSVYLYGSAEGAFRNYMRWMADARYTPAGYRSGDLHLAGRLSLSAYVNGHPLTLDGSLSYDLRSPSYWSEHYTSNHFEWSNSFSKEGETRAEATFSVPDYGIRIGGFHSIVNNRIYYDSGAEPVQYGGTVNVSGLFAQGDFRLGILHLNHRVLLQSSSRAEIIPVPSFGAYLSYFLRIDVVRDVLRMHLGLDCRYTSEYYGFGYNPAVMQFHNQQEYMVGGYPMVDAFVNAKWKRMRIFLRWQHLNMNLFGNNNYFTTARYPQSQRVMKLGVSWSFYD